MNLLTFALPLYANIVVGVVLILMFTGSWVLLNDLSKLTKGPVSSNYQIEVDSALMKIRVRRILVLLAGIGLIIMYFWGKNMVGISALIFGVFIWDTMKLIGRTRRFVNSLASQ